jgi:molybdopterin adenylyltransferase
MSEPHDPVRVGLVATSDRASQGVYRDEGIPALEQWLARALLNPVTFERRLIPDERPVIEATLKELVD